MRNLVECNIVIPKIITIFDEKNGEDIIQVFIKEHKIDISHVLVLRPEKDELTIDQIRQMQKDIHVSFSKEVLVVLHNLDNSGSEVQNSLLKILEEQSERIHFVLLVKDAARLLPTIVSRCTLITDKNFPLSKDKKMITDPLEYFSFKTNSDTTRDGATIKIDQFLDSGAIRSGKNLRYILTIRKILIENNMNPILALDSILLFLSKTGTMKVPHAKTK